MSFEPVREKANRLRSVPLAAVLDCFAATPDRHDKNKWHTGRGVISVNGPKFFNWTRDLGGGGAIDLTIHLLGDCGFLQALDWLDDHFPDHQQLLPQTEPPCTSHSPALQLPGADPLQLGRVRTYLIKERCIAAELVDRLMESGVVYADARANAVFVHFDFESEARAVAVGAELRGTGPVPWRGMARGSRKDAGYFAVFEELEEQPHPAPVSERNVVLCESAIDAISCLIIFPGATCISTAGVRGNPAWLAGLLERGGTVYCGFDNDAAGDGAARAMIAAHPGIGRLRPIGHDWNDMLVSCVKHSR